MDKAKILIFAVLIGMNIVIWSQAVGLGFIVGVALTTVFFILISRKGG